MTAAGCSFFRHVRHSGARSFPVDARHYTDAAEVAASDEEEASARALFFEFEMLSHHTSDFDSWLLSAAKTMSPALLMSALMRPAERRLKRRAFRAREERAARHAVMRRSPPRTRRDILSSIVVAFPLQPLMTKRYYQRRGIPALPRRC